MKLIIIQSGRSLMHGASNRQERGWNKLTSDMMPSDKILFTPIKIGPVALRNRVIRAAAFEGLCPGNLPSAELLNYHKVLAAGGVGMTTVAYAAIEPSGLSFPHQLLFNKAAVPELKELTDAVHREGAALRP